ncbi:hypothetical protein A2U01_0110007, partial [Trifolium medium]|nr:hypothetical protein [Trifolium medium]
MERSFDPEHIWNLDPEHPWNLDQELTLNLKDRPMQVNQAT